MEENTEKQTIFMEIFESLKEMVNNQTICEEIKSGDISQSLIDAVYLKTCEITEQLKNFVTENKRKTNKSPLPSTSNQVNRAQQKQTDYRSMDRSLSLGRIICQYMTHVAQEFKKDSSYWNNLDLISHFAVPQILENGDYFIGFCHHKEETHNQMIHKVSIPKYGMLFKAKSDGWDSLYIGPCDDEGVPHTDPETKLSGLHFFDLEFLDQPLATNQKSFFIGEFFNGLFQGRGELLICKKNDYTVDMPLILTKNREFSQIHFKSNTAFKAGKLGVHCDLELIYELSKLQDPNFKTIKSYVGNMYDGVFHGKGSLKYTNGDEYLGMFKFGRKDGEGVYKCKNYADEYDSMWQEDLLHGKCRILFGANNQNSKVDLGDFEMGWNRVGGETIQINVLTSFLSSEYDYTPPVSKGIDLPETIQFECPKLKFDVEGMLKKAFQNKNQNLGDKAMYHYTN